MKSIQTFKVLKTSIYHLLYFCDKIKTMRKNFFRQNKGELKMNSENALKTWTETYEWRDHTGRTCKRI